MIYSLKDLINGLGGVNETTDALNWFKQSESHPVEFRNTEILKLK